ncbi:hypothetical protein L1887_15114 [Cichorium endivia]|nr:hypothetical protein L1887_15114 [Cichorium endivia]
MIRRSYFKPIDLELGSGCVPNKRVEGPQRSKASALTTIEWILLAPAAVLLFCLNHSPFPKKNQHLYSLHQQKLSFKLKLQQMPHYQKNIHFSNSANEEESDPDTIFI